MRGNLYAVKVVKSGVFFVTAGAIGLAGFLQCTRDNPIDPGSDDYIPGSAPLAGFAADTVQCLATDPVQITVSFSDTQALGGKTPAVTTLYFNWNGNSDSLTDSVTVTAASPVVISRVFNLVRNVSAYVRARDNDGMIGPAGSMRLIVAAGALPEADFIAGSVTGFIRDSISMTVTWSDTQAYGGKTPAVTELHFYWNGDSSLAVTPEIVAVSGAGPLTFTRVFTTSRNTMVYVRALDNDLNIGPASGMRLIVDEGVPRITVRPAASDDSVLTGDSITVTVSASDTNGTVVAYIWTVLGSNTTTAAGQLRYAFPDTAAGTRTIYVRVIDDDGVMSARDSVDIRVVPRVDSTGPVIQFVSPLNNAVVTSQVISVILEAGDPSAVLFVNINSVAASRISGSDILGVYRRDNVPLDTGITVIIIQSMDTRYNQSWDTLRVNYQKPDYTPPAIAFSYPEAGDTVYQSPVSVAVTVTDLSGVAWVTCGADTMDNPSGNSYTVSVVPVEGANSLVITARDTRGNTAVDTLDFSYVIRDRTPPFVHITAPLDSARITADSVTVSVTAYDTGTWTSGIASVTVNGLPAAYNGMALAYERKISLTHGSNTIVAIATDGSPVHNQSADTVTVVQDRPPHFVPDTAVRDTGLLVGSTALFNFCATDPDSDPVSFSFVTTPSKSSSFSITGSGSCVVLSYLPDSAGLDTFRVRMADSVYGAADTILVRVTNTMPDNTPPAIVFVTPEPGDTVTQSPVTVVVSVSDQSGVAWVKCGADTMTFISGSNYSRSVVLTGEGEHSLVISASDTRANTASDTLIFVYVIRDKTPPVVQITAPLDSARITADSVQVSVQASDTGTYASGISSVTVNGFAAVYSAPYWRRTILLAHGSNTVIAVATDASPVANQARDTVVVIHNIAPHFVPDTSVRDTGLVVGAAAVISLCATDPDSDPLLFSFVTTPSKAMAYGLVKAGSCATVSYTPDSTGLDTFRVRVADSVYGLADTILVRVTNTVPDITPPVIAFTAPQYGDTVHQSPVTVVVSVTDPSGVAWVRCNDSAMTNVSGSSYSRSVTLTAEGQQSFVISAADTKANAAADTLVITYTIIRDTVAPLAHITSPLSGQRIASSTVQVTVAASDTGAVRSGIASVTVNGLSASFTAGYYVRSGVALAHGFDTIRVVAADSAGNTAADSVIVLRNAFPQFDPDVTVKDTSLWLDSNQTVQFAATDADGDTLVFSMVSAPQHNGDSAYMVNEPGDYAHLAGYRPDTVGLDTFRVRVADSWGGADTLKVSVTVIDKGSLAPYFTISTPPDTAIIDSLYSVLLTAVDPQGLALGYSLDYSVTPSGWSINGTGLFTGTSPGPAATVTIRAIVTNAMALSDTLEWLMHIVLRNYPPVLANPGNRTVNEGTALQFTLSASDTNGDPLRFSFGSSAPAGATLDSMSGLFSWTPAYNQAGVYVIVFRVTERYRSPSLADTVIDTVTVVNVNRPPVLVNPGNRTVYEHSSVSIILQATDPDADSIAYSVTGAPAGASIVNGNNFIWTPTGHQSGVYPIVFHATDNGSPVLSSSVIDTVTVLDTSKPVFGPHSSPDTAYVALLYSTSVHAADPDTDVMIYTKLAGPTALMVSMVTGAVTWTPALADTSVIYTVQVTAADPSGNRDTVAWSVRTLVPDYAPHLTNPGRMTDSEGVLLIATITATDANGDSLRYSFGSTYPAGATIDSVSGLFRWTPTYSQAGTYTVVFKVTEQGRVPALADSVIDTITVANVNRAPVITNPGRKTVNESSALSFYLQASDPDGDSIAYSMLNAPAGATLVNGNNFIWTPTGHQSGSYRVTLIATDNGSPSLSGSVIDTITVLDNTFPVLDAHKLLDTAWVGIQYSTPVHAVDADSDGVFYVKDTAVPPGVVVNRATGVLTWTPTSIYTGLTIGMRVFASDSSGNLDTVTWTVRVLVPDYPPVLMNPGNMTVNERQDLLRTLTATDANGDPLRFSFGSTYPAGATIDSVSGIFQWTPTYKQAGVYTVVFKVTERGRSPALADSVTDTITVVNVNNPPVFVFPPDGSVFTTYEKVKIAFTLSATDLNGDSLTYSMIGAPNGALLLNNTGFTWTPTYLQGGSAFGFAFVVTDSGSPAMSDTSTVNIIVRDTVKPVFTTNIAYDSAYVKVPYTFTVVAVDADGDPITYSLLDAPRYMTIDSRYGIISWTPETSYNDTIMPVRVIAADHAGNLDTLAYSLHVFLRWPRTYGSLTASDTGFSVILTASGRYAVCGTVGDSAFFLLTDTSGTRLYYQKYGGARARWSANCIREVLGDGFIMCGTDSSTLAGGLERLMLIRVDGKGETYYVNHFLPEKTNNSRGSSVTMTADGMFAACGTAKYTGNTGLASAMYVVKAPDAATVVPLWEQVYYTGVVTFGAYSKGRGIQMTSDNGFIVTGEIMQSVATLGTGIFTVKTNPIGDTVWTNIHHMVSGTGLRNYGTAVMESMLGMEDGYYVSGSFTTMVGATNGVVIKISYKGDFTWYYVVTNAMGTGIRATADGGCIASMCYGTVGTQQPYLVKLAQTGGIMWRYSYAIASNGGAYDVAKLAGNTGYVMTGFTLRAGMIPQNDVLLVRTDAGGVVVK